MRSGIPSRIPGRAGDVRMPRRTATIVCPAYVRTREENPDRRIRCHREWRSTQEARVVPYPELDALPYKLAGGSADAVLKLESSWRWRASRTFARAPRNCYVSQPVPLLARSPSLRGSSTSVDKRGTTTKDSLQREAASWALDEFFDQSSLEPIPSGETGR